MITKIKRLRNFGIFQDFHPNDDLQLFKKYNLFYGWNGSGKSTLSRLFRILEKRHIPDIYDDCYFEVELQNGTIVKPVNIHELSEKIFVFNQEFIEENIDWDDTVESILLVSKEKIEERKELNKKIEEEEEIRNEIINVNNKYKELSTKQEMTLSKIAKDIKQNFNFLSTTDTYYINYNKTKLKKLIDNNFEEIKSKKYLLEDSILNELVKAAKPEMKDIIQFSVRIINEELIKNLYKDIRELLNQKVTGNIIKKLQENPNLSKWVEEGLEIHKNRDGEFCEFCGNPLNEQRVIELEKHFNKSFKEIKSKISNLIMSIESQYIDLKLLPSKELFYDEFHEKYNTYRARYEILATKVNDYFNEWTEELRNKYDNPFVDIGPNINFNLEKLVELNKVSININQLIEKHNDKTNDFTSKVKEVQKKLELHYATENLHDFDYFIIKNAVDENNEKLQKLISKDRAIKNRITELNSSLLDAGRGAEEFNNKLFQFLGHNELLLEYDNSKKGYRIVRLNNGNKIQAKNLSEGEKTAIAFVYFITKLNEKNNNIAESIVVIDDPISSFDSNNLFNSYSYLRDECNDTKQLFVFTHNFAFFRLIRDWMKGKIRKINDNGTKKKVPNYSFYTIEVLNNQQRESTICNAHDSITQYETEYHYVFYKLYQYKDRKQLNIEESYLIANLSRKLLESFFSFKFPKSRNNFRELMEKGFDNEQTFERVYKFINKYSHHQYFDFHDLTSDNLLGESYNVIEDIFETLKSVDKVHYFEMVEIVRSKDHVLNT